MLLKQIIDHVGARRTTPGFQAYVTRNNGWIIGSYRELKLLAQELRFNAGLRKTVFGGEQDSARIGRREDDHAPSGPRTVTSFRTAIQDKSPQSSEAALAEKYAHLRHGPGSKGQFAPRFTDQFEEVADFYQDKTLEAHHIVEKSILGTLKVNTGDLDNEQAPCVLIAAELHQRLFTLEIASARGQFVPAMTGNEMYQKLKGIYDGLYFSPIMKELKDSAELINQEVKKRKPAS